MAPRKWIDRNSATTYKLVHRQQNDPLIHDDGASAMVFQELLPPQAAKKGKTLNDLHSQLSETDYHVRDNEGEAAEYGVYYDDTEYDYMQHLRDLGSGGGDAYFVEAAPVTVKGKGKGKEKVSLDEALKELDLEHEQHKEEFAGRLVDQAILPSKNLRHVTYQDQQDVPDVLAGFQPDMDPRLREAMEALEDDAYVDNEDQDLFDMLAGGGEEIDDHDFEETWQDEDDEGWETDDTAKPIKEYKSKAMPGTSLPEEGNRSYPAQPTPESLPSESTPPTLTTPELPPSDAAPPDAPADPLAAFNAHKARLKSTISVPSTASAIRDPRIHDGAVASTVLSNTSLMSGRHKKRKGAMTNPSAFSMTSSALQRTEGLTTLDARFDRIMEVEYEDEDAEKYYGADDETASVATGITGKQSMASALSVASGMSKMSMASSRAPDLVRRDYSGVMDMMDEFLGSYGGGAVQPGDRKAAVTKKGPKVRRGYGGKTGLEQLTEIRKELGRPRISA